VAAQTSSLPFSLPGKFFPSFFVSIFLGIAVFFSLNPGHACRGIRRMYTLLFFPRCGLHHLLPIFLGTGRKSPLSRIPPPFLFLAVPFSLPLNDPFPGNNRGPGKAISPSFYSLPVFFFPLWTAAGVFGQMERMSPNSFASIFFLTMSCWPLLPFLRGRGFWMERMIPTWWAPFLLLASSRPLSFRVRAGHARTKTAERGKISTNSLFFSFTVFSP